MALHSSSPFRPPRIHFNMKISRSPRRWRCTQESGIKVSVRASGTEDAVTFALKMLHFSGAALDAPAGRPSATTDVTPNKPPRAATGGAAPPPVELVGACFVVEDDQWCRYLHLGERGEWRRGRCDLVFLSFGYQSFGSPWRECPFSSYVASPQMRLVAIRLWGVGTGQKSKIPPGTQREGAHRNAVIVTASQLHHGDWGH